MKKLVVDKKYNNKKLNTFLLDTFSGLSQNTIYKYLRKKDILINGIRINSNISLNTGDEVIIYIPDTFLECPNSKFDVAYEDNNILILDKPVRY